jgi:Domain of unknown function (DUF6457)
MSERPEGRESEPGPSGRGSGHQHVDSPSGPAEGQEREVMAGNEWIAAFADRLGVPPPDASTVDTLLALAGTAAHASERTAAPIACYLVGRAGIDPDEAGRVAEEVAPTA